ncbi:MAG: DUF1330 domain-containing protein [Pseudomonadota bacterium]
MSKGYWVVALDAADQLAVSEILQQLSFALTEHSGKVLTNSDRDAVTPTDDEERVIIVEFPSLAAAKACMEGDAYQRTRPMRDAVSSLHIIVIEEAHFDGS